MKKDILLEYALRANVHTGNISAFYNLSGSVDTIDPSDRDIHYKAISGATKNVFDTYVIYNQLHPTGSQVIYTGNENTAILSEDRSPAVISSSSSSITGSGIFDSQSTLKYVKKLTDDNWTCFLDFSGDLASRKPNLNQVLFSTMPEANSSSGLHVGINGSNRIYYEYVSGEVVSNNYNRESQTLSNHLKKQNVISIAKNPNLLEVSLHTPDQGAFSIKTSADNFNQSEDLFFGGFKDGSSYNHFFTGFSGNINSIVLFNNYLPETHRNTFSEAYFLKTYNPAGFTTFQRTTKQVTGSEIQSLASGFGITGYEYRQTGSYTNEAGESIPLYGNSGVKGVVYRNILVDVTGEANITSTTGFYSQESSERDLGYVRLCNSVPGKITFNRSLSSDEYVEIYNHHNFLDTINLTSDNYYSLQQVPISDNELFELRGVELQSDKFSYVESTKQPNIQVFIDGVAQQEVSGLHAVDRIYESVAAGLDGTSFSDYKGDYFIHNNEAGINGSAGISDRIENNKYQIFLNPKTDYANLSEKDIILFDVVSGDSLTGRYESVDAHYTDEYLNKDIYLDGQKLTSGVDYNESTFNGKVSVKLESDALNLSWPDGGDLLFMPHASSSFSVTTSNAGGKEFAVSNIFFEQVWINGIRQAPGIDYYKSPDNSLVGSSTPSLENNSFDFKSTSNLIDSAVDDVISEKSAGKTRQKVFSFDAKGKTNLFDD